MKRLFIVFLFIGFITNINFAQFGFRSDIVKIQFIDGQDSAHRNSNFKFAVKAIIDKEWHINSDRPNEDFLIATQLISKDEKFPFASVVFPEAKDLSFEFSDVSVSVFDGEIVIGALIRIDNELPIGNYKIPIQFRYQACNDHSCMPPTSITDTLSINVVEDSTPLIEINNEVFSRINFSQTIDESNLNDSLSSTLASSGLFFSLLIIFLGGLALNLTPCVYPLIPITVGYFGGQSEGSTKRLFLLGSLYVLGMALTYSVIGVVTSLSGALFGTLLQNQYVIIGIALLFIILALSQFGVYEFKLPDSFVAKAGGAKTGVFGAFFMGLTMGIVAAPCIGPFVIGLVTYVAALGDAFYGFLMFFILALGLGLPYLILALFSGKIKKLPRAGDWMEGVKHIFGFLLLGMAFYFIDPLLPKLVSNYLLPVYGIIAAVILIFIDKTANKVKGFRFFKLFFAGLVLLLSVYSLLPSSRLSPDWEKFEISSYEMALANNNKIIIDFYADWCIPCKELDALTFSDPRVIDEMKNFSIFKVDMTQTLSEEAENLRKQFNILGMPTVLLIDSNGNEVNRLTGFVNANEFLKLIQNVK